MDRCQKLFLEEPEHGPNILFSDDLPYSAKKLLELMTLYLHGKGRAMDNIFIERLWRTVNYEDIYTMNYESAEELIKGPRTYFEFYNNERLHKSFGGRTPAEVYWGTSKLRKAA